MTTRVILHVDMDAFFASVEQRDDPDLRGRPVLVGGSGRRGVVAAASYEAREYGCHSALPMAIARRRCPHAVVVRGRYDEYRSTSREVFDIFETFTPVIQPLSIDEAFLDVTGSQRLLGTGPEIARAIRERILKRVGLTASVGVAPNKFLAKLASDLDKPDGLTIVPNDNIEAFLAPLPVTRMWGVGPAMEKRLAGVGIRTFGDLRRLPRDILEKRFGSHAVRMHDLAAGLDAREVVPDSRSRSISQERTFGHNLADPDVTRQMLLGEVEQVARRLRRHGFRARTITLKIRYGDFETITRSSTLDAATDRTARLWREARLVFDQWASSGYRPVRLIGFGTSHLTREGEQLDLFTAATDEKQSRLDRATDEIMGRFGTDAIRRGGGGG